MKRIGYIYLIPVLIPFFISLSLTVKATSEAGGLEIRTTEPLVSLYPMPVSGTLHIAFRNTPSMEPEILLYDILGNLVADLRPERQFSGEYTVNLSERKPGYYFIKVKAGSETFSRRITVTQ